MAKRNTIETGFDDSGGKIRPGAAFVFLCGFLLCGPVRAGDEQTITIDLRLDRLEAFVGEPIRGAVTLRWSDRLKVPAGRPEEFGPFQVIRVDVGKERRTPSGEMERVVEFDLTAFELGELELPALAFTYFSAEGTTETIATDPRPILMKSLVEELGGEAKVALRPMRPPMEMAPDWKRIALWALGGVAIAVVAGYLFYRLMQRLALRPDGTPRGAAPLLPADEEALRALAEVETERMADSGRVKEYYTRLSEILRRYVGRRHRFDALDMTSSELLEQVREVGWPIPLCDMLAGDTAECDSVKFAKFVPVREKRGAALERVRRIVLDTRPKPVETTEGQGDEGEAGA